MRWPVFRLSWLNEIFSLSEVAGYSATGQVTRDKRRKPFQLARGAIRKTPLGRLGFKTIDAGRFRHPARGHRDSSSTGRAAPADANKNGTCPHVCRPKLPRPPCVYRESKSERIDDEVRPKIGRAS